MDSIGSALALPFRGLKAEFFLRHKDKISAIKIFYFQPCQIFKLSVKKKLGYLLLEKISKITPAKKIGRCGKSTKLHVKIRKEREES